MDVLNGIVCGIGFKNDILTKESSESYRPCFKYLRVDRGFFRLLLAYEILNHFRHLNSVKGLLLIVHLQLYYLLLRKKLLGFSLLGTISYYVITASSIQMLQRTPKPLKVIH